MGVKSGPTMINENSPVWVDADSVEVMVRKGELDSFEWATLKLALHNALSHITGTQSNTYVIQGEGGDHWEKPEPVFSARVNNPLVNELSVKRLRNYLEMAGEEFDCTIVLTFGRRV
jgi:hypothetical protein